MATSSTYVIPSIIAAAASIFCAVLLAWVAIRAQSNSHQLERIDRLIDTYAQKITDDIVKELSEMVDPDKGGLAIAEIVKRALRDVLGSHPLHRRWYER